MKAILTAALLVAVAMAGCSGDGDEVVEDDIPVAISRQEVEELEERLLEEHPRAFEFPGQQIGDPLYRLIEGVMDVGTGTGLEPVDDDGLADVGGSIIIHDLSDLVPAGQPFEIRAALKWFGDPGAAADLDFYVNVPGTLTTYSNRDEESWNWAIINKQLILNTVRIEGEPFEIGVQAQNGKIVHPDGMRYQIEVEAYPVAGVVAPFVPWAVSVPPEATGMILESEPVTGDEHVETEMVIVRPDGSLHRIVVHNDIGTETLFIPTSGPGEYVVYVSEQHGGFIRLETDVPNPGYLARALSRTVTETVVATGAVTAPGAPGTYGSTGDIDLSAGVPLDIEPFIRAASPVAVDVDVQFDILSGGGIVHSLLAQGMVHGDLGRIGGPFAETRDLTMFDGTSLSWGMRGNVGLGAEVGYTVIGYGA